MIQRNTKLKQGFTIVELLVVIVVIGILAAITIVSYTGVSARANAAANKANANGVLKAALDVYTESTSNLFPDTSATSSTVITNLNANSAKVPASLTVTNTTVTSGTSTAISYRITTDKKGACVGYWDPSLATPAAVYLYGGTATADNGTTCS